MKSSIIGERLTVAAFLLILSASMVGLSLSIKNSEQQQQQDENNHKNTGKPNKLKSLIKEHSNKEKEPFGCECMLRTVSISFRNFGLLADLDQIVLPLSKKKSNPAEKQKEPQEEISGKKKKFLHGSCPDKFMSELSSYPSVSSAQGKHVKNNETETLTQSDDHQTRTASSNYNFGKSHVETDYDPWSVNVGRCLGICYSHSNRDFNKFGFSNNTQVEFNSSLVESGRTNDYTNSNKRLSPSSNEGLIDKNDKLFNNLLLPSQTRLACRPTSSKRKKISIRIPWSTPQSDFNPSMPKSKMKGSKAKSVNSNTRAQQRSTSPRSNGDEVKFQKKQFNNFEEALTIFSEVEEHLACSCQDPNLIHDQNGNQFFNSEQFNKGNVKSSKGEKISSKPSKGRTRRSALNNNGESAVQDIYQDSLEFNVNGEENSLDTEDSKSSDWMKDVESSTGIKTNFRHNNKNKFNKYMPSSGDVSDSFSNTKKSTSSSTASNDEERSLRDNEYNNTITEDDSVSIYYDTCLACKEQQETCEKTGQIYDPEVCRCVFPASRTFLNSFYTLGVVMLTVMVCCFLVFGVQKGDENVLNTSRQSGFRCECCECDCRWRTCSRSNSTCTRRSTSTGRRRSGSSYQQHERPRDYSSVNSYHPPRLAVTSGTDCELGGATTTILHHTPGHSPLRIMDRSQISSAAVCHTHPNRKNQSTGGTIASDDLIGTKNNKDMNRLVRPVSATGGGGGISATTSATVVAAASFARSMSQTNSGNDVEL